VFLADHLDGGLWHRRIPAPQSSRQCPGAAALIAVRHDQTRPPSRVSSATEQLHGTEHMRAHSGKGGMMPAVNCSCRCDQAGQSPCTTRTTSSVSRVEVDTQHSLRCGQGTPANVYLCARQVVIDSRTAVSWAAAWHSLSILSVMSRLYWWPQLPRVALTLQCHQLGMTGIRPVSKGGLGDFDASAPFVSD
jgi:hypothetical protein